MHTPPITSAARHRAGQIDAGAPVGRLVPGTVGPWRQVPGSIARPEYVGRDAPTPFTGSYVTDDATLARMRVACRLAARALQAVGETVAPGVTTDELDRVGHDFLVAAGAYPSTLGYRHFPKSLCTSVNEVVCHGIPDSTVLLEGDIVNVDITAYLVVDGVGVHGDTNATFAVGEVDPVSERLMVVARECMERGIDAVRPGRAVNVIGRVIEKHARRAGFGSVREFTGHGISTAFHSGLVVPHFDSAPEHGDVIEPGMTFTIEPMITLGPPTWTMWDDGWTVLTADRQRTAQYEHTMVVTDTGAEVLTLA